MFLVFELLLFFIITKMLKKELNFYYQKKKRVLLVLTIASVIFFVVRLLMTIGTQFFNLRPDVILYVGNFSQKVNFNTSKFVGIMLFDILSYAPIIFYAYFNMSNINFKIYLLEIMKGYLVHSYYPEASIFLISRVNSSRSSLLTASNNPSTSTYESLIEEIEDLEVTNGSINRDRMYKQNYLEIHRSNQNRRMRSNNISTDEEEVKE